MRTVEELRSYQKGGINLLLKNPKYGLFYDMGLGKTVVTLTALKELFTENKIKKALIIAPKKVAEDNWHREAADWMHINDLTCIHVLGSANKREKALKENVQIYIINQENVEWLCKYYKYNLPFGAIAIDEFSSFRNHASKRFRALAKSAEKTPYFYGLTGTPTPQSMVNLWAQIYFLDRGERLGKTITEFRREYCMPDFVQNGVVRTYKVRPEKIPIILEKIKDITCSLKAEDCIELPKIFYNYINVSLPKSVLTEYKNFEKNKIIELNKKEVTAVNIAVLLRKLLQFANGAIYTNAEGDFEEVHNEKLNALEDMVENLNGKTLLIAYVFKSDKTRILKKFEKYNIRALQTSQDIQDWNAGKIQILLAHPASAGHGLNLQYGGYTALWFGLPNDLELYEQFNKRLHRPGQKNNVIIHHLIAHQTKERLVIDALKNKKNIQDLVMDFIKLK